MNDSGFTRKIIRTYEDLLVYQNSYKGMLIIFKDILPKMPKEERFDLVDQIRRSSKAIPRLIAEGHSKRHQLRGFIKYLDDAHAESNETIVSLNQIKDLYGDISKDMTSLCLELITLYDMISRQLYKLSKNWINYPQGRQ